MIKGVINIFFSSLYIGSRDKNNGTNIQTENHAMISVGRWTQTIILENHIIRENHKNIIQSRVIFLSFFSIHRINIHTANPMDMAAWSDGNDDDGKNWCKKVSSSIQDRTASGLDLLKNIWRNTLNADENIADQNIRREHSL